MKIIAINAGKRIRGPENYCFMITMMGDKEPALSDENSRKSSKIKITNR